VLNALREGRAPDGDVVVLTTVQKQEAVKLAQVHGVQKNMTVIVSDTPDNDQTTAANGDDTSQWVAVVKGGRPSMKKLECTSLQGAKADAPKHEVEGPEPPAVRATTTVRVTMVKEFMTDAQWKTARQRPGAVATGDLDKDAILAAEAFSEVLEAGKLVALIGYLTVAAAGLAPVLAASGAYGRFYRVLAKDRSAPDGVAVPGVHDMDVDLDAEYITDEQKRQERYDQEDMDLDGLAEETRTTERAKRTAAREAECAQVRDRIKKTRGEAAAAPAELPGTAGPAAAPAAKAAAKPAAKPPPKRKNPFEAIDPGSNGGDCGCRGLAAGWALLGGVAEATRENTLNPAKLEIMAKTLRAQLALRISNNQEFFQHYWARAPLGEGKEDGAIPTTWEEYVAACKRPKRWIDGLSYQAGCDHVNRHIYTYTGVGAQLNDVNWVDKVTWIPQSPDAQRTALLQPPLHVGLWKDHCYILLPDDGARHKKETKRPSKAQLEERIRKICRHGGSTRKADRDSDSEVSWMATLARARSSRKRKQPDAPDSWLGDLGPTATP
ncbi:unnamed protein product, partial [Prorocentrum cordatum]